MDPDALELGMTGNLDQLLAAVDRRVALFKERYAAADASPELVVQTVDSLAAIVRDWAASVVTMHAQMADLTLLADENARLTQALRRLVAETDRLQAELARR